jgi:CRP/FNR family transcriptional regulator, cyclic AMP receptor protein
VAKPDPVRLKSQPLFSSLNEDECELLSHWVEEREIPEGKVLGAEGDAGYFFFVIEEGKAEVTREGRRLNELGPGDFFGEIAILGGGRRTATVAATSPMRLLVIFGLQFREMEAQIPEVAERIRGAMEERLARA